MEIRQVIIQSVLQALQGKAEPEVLDTVQDVLVIQLNQYEIQERSTELTVSDNSTEGMLRRYIATKRIEGKAESTLRRYWEQNLKLIQFLQKPLHEITTDDIRFYMAYRRQQGRVSNRTLDGMRRCYRSFFSWLSAEGIISRNPCAALNQIKSRKQIKKPYSAVELELIRKSCTDDRDLALVEFLYSTGCRVSEVSELDTVDIDMATGECIVIGKGNKERTVYLTDVAMLHLQTYLNSRTDNSIALFAGKGTPRLTKGGIETLLKRIGRAAGVENVHPHRFRRTLATEKRQKKLNTNLTTNISVAHVVGTSFCVYNSQFVFVHIGVEVPSKLEAKDTLAILPSDIKMQAVPNIGVVSTTGNIASIAIENNIVYTNPTFPQGNYFIDLVLKRA